MPIIKDSCAHELGSAIQFKFLVSKYLVPISNNSLKAEAQTTLYSISTSKVESIGTLEIQVKAAIIGRHVDLRFYSFDNLFL